MNFTFNNHLQYYIGSKLYGERLSPYEKFLVKVGKIDEDRFKNSSWYTEQLRTASLVSQEYGKDFVLMFSGGTDSEIVLRSFLKINKIPRCIFINFKNGYNHDDLIEAKKVTDSLNVNLEVIDFDVIDFYRSGQAEEFAKTIHCSQMAYLTVYHHILKLGLPAVMGGELLLRRYVNKTGFKWYYTFRENEDASAMRFSLKYNLPLVNEWFSYTPEMILYYIQDDDIKALITNRFNYKISSVSSKNSILKKLFPSVLDKKKTHGYEKLLGFNGETYQTLSTKYVKRLEYSLDGIFVDDLVNQLTGNIS